MTKYNELVDHLVSTMKGNSMTNDVTNSKKDWDDFWYNSEDNSTEQSNNQDELNFIIKEIETQSKKPIEEQLNDLKIAGAKLLVSIDKIIEHLNTEEDTNHGH